MNRSSIADADARLLDWAEEALGHRFAEATLLRRALTHRSHGGEDYERLEFLGDRVLGCVMADWLFERFASEPEGRLTRRFATLVSRETCAEVARALGLGTKLRLGLQARTDGGARSGNILGDAVEALIGALWLDGGLEAARRFVRAAWEPHIAGLARAPKHPKSALQEWAASTNAGEPAYELVARTGLHHAPTFRVRVTLRGRDPVEAEGSSKQEAETEAAKAMLAQVLS